MSHPYSGCLWMQPVPSPPTPPLWQLADDFLHSLAVKIKNENAAVRGSAHRAVSLIHSTLWMENYKVRQPLWLSACNSFILSACIGFLVRGSRYTDRSAGDLHGTSYLLNFFFTMRFLLEGFPFTSCAIAKTGSKKKFLQSEGILVSQDFEICFYTDHSK